MVLLSALKSRVRFHIRYLSLPSGRRAIYKSSLVWYFTILDSVFKVTEMPYCKTALIVTEQMNTRAVLDQLAQTKFNAPCAVQCEWNESQFVIDNGMNNIRAVIDSERGLILLHCRYSPYVDIGEELIKQFAAEQGFLTESLDD